MFLRYNVRCAGPIFTIAFILAGPAMALEEPKDEK